MSVPGPDLAWRTPLDACRLILTGRTFRTAARIAAIVGTILTTVNQGSLIVAGDATLATWIRTAANYAIPYTVASIGYLTPFRHR